MLALGLSQKPKKRFLLAEIEPLIKKTVKFLKALKEVEQVVVAGSVRRQKKILVTSIFW
jgi:spore coat polysaccharide biosynthesis protein SpsF (cytidylyltransferase family)